MARYSLVLFLLIPFHFIDYSPKKDQLLQLSKKYFPEGYVILQQYDEKDIDDIAKGDSLKDYINSVCTVIHEGYHNYQNLHSSYYEATVRYRINDTLSIDVKNQKTFPSKEIDKLVSPAIRKRIFRYDTYVDAKDKYHVTQQFGIFGLLEEAIAYYTSFSTAISLYNYYKDQYGWSDPNPWISYLSNMASYRYSIIEFELFISWYLQLSKKDNPPLYHALISDPSFRKLLRVLFSEQRRLSDLYNTHFQQMLAGLGDKVKVGDGYLFNTRTHTGSGLYDAETREMNTLLAKPEHREFLELVK